jgi:hypothetical protein
MSLQVGYVWRGCCRADCVFDESSERLGMHQVALDLVSAPSQALESSPANLGRLDLRSRVPVHQLERRQIISNQLKSLVVVARSNPGSSRSWFDHSALPEEAGGQHLAHWVVEQPSPGAEDIEVSIVFQIKHPGRGLCSHDIGVRQHPQGFDEAGPLLRRGEKAWLVEDDA